MTTELIDHAKTAEPDRDCPVPAPVDLRPPRPQPPRSRLMSEHGREVGPRRIMVGSVVRLRTGNAPVMTVERIADGAADVLCWGREHRRAVRETIPVECLRLLRPWWCWPFR